MADSGHLLLMDAPDACLAIIKRLLAEHVAAAGRPGAKGPERPLSPWRTPRGGAIASREPVFSRGESRVRGTVRFVRD